MKRSIPIPLLRAPIDRAISLERIERAPEEVRNSVHRHDYSEIFVFASGTGTHMIDLRHHVIARPCIHAVRGGQVHHLVRSGDMEGFVFEFVPGALTDPVHQRDLEHILNAMERVPCLPLDEARLAVLSDLARMFELEASEGQDRQQQVLSGYLGIALAKCARWWSEILPKDDPAEEVNNDLLARFRALVDKHFMEMLQVRDYAERLHVTPGHLNDVVRKRTGATASQLVDERLQLEAKRLLLHSEMSVKETGFALGMHDPAYFTRWFKKVEGRTPADYRAKVRDQYRGA